MATSAQIDANRRNAQKSSGPRTAEGKNRSRMNALDHGGRASILALPPEEFAQYEEWRLAWKRAYRPRCAAEEVLIDRITALDWQEKWIERAKFARLSSRVSHSTVDEADREKEQVLKLSQKLFRGACGTKALHLHQEIGERSDDDQSPRISSETKDEEHPMFLVHRLQTTLTGCEWLLDQWARLRELLEEGAPWFPADKLKAIRLLGYHPIDAIDYMEAAQVYLACHVLSDDGGEPFQEILNELSADEAPIIERYWKRRKYLTPADASAARELLLQIIDGAVFGLEAKADALREIAEIDAEHAVDRLRWDDTPEGERLRRYDMACKRMWLRLSEMHLRVRQNGEKLDLGMIQTISRSAPTVVAMKTDPGVSSDSIGMASTEEPVHSADLPSEPNSSGEKAPNEPNSVGEKAPNEPNLVGEAIRGGGSEGRRDLRIDAPHLDRKPGAIGSTGKGSHLPAFESMLNSRKQPLLDLTPIFGQR
jgi:hypothetical protein